ncbi:hypothetical protein A3A95_02315 [Candidatus Nomurabacteria bacterium RIFCSPLOWO2_01_FULL_39_18]|uniref:Uncharacterized protein n=1 Tax=Candidatus Nomurabacteria bacterium RIFCSPHIGHO2_01_FULL_40_24b TaxID=1801739 RepID=A0A1F6V5L1_9BACT|nr:MAG: hypothetical protein A2647_02070 [Candidatus Nomurabacteria bacterium RIFCSPHIGHO2_01_FULL_40_24b]OGI90696.1 MAG: hypothetical protein A3A95_02315 [Candidatus Nomurabacteria bacterium RIFCSPLOWO2_01_FULL_39_18]
MLNTFWKWYKDKYRVIAPLTALLFLLQLVHLYWMTTNVVFSKTFGHSLWDPSSFWDTVIALVDYTEIPAIVTSSIFYIYQYMQDKSLEWRSILFLFFINSQWLHLFWITDEVIYAQFTGTALVAIPVWLSWIAISIDYLELPVIYDTIKKAIKSLRKQD